MCAACDILPCRAAFALGRPFFVSGVRELLNTYAIVQTGSKQYRVQAGDNIRVESLPVYTGEIVNIDDVLMVSRDGDVKVGTPVVDGARVRAQVTSRGRGRKITVFKYKSKVRYRRTKGHRQHYTDLRIIDISMDGESLDAVEERMASLDDVEETADIVESDVAVDTESVSEEAADETEDDAPVAEDDQADGEIPQISPRTSRKTILRPMRRSPKTTKRTETIPQISPRTSRKTTLRTMRRSPKTTKRTETTPQTTPRTSRPTSRIPL